MREIKIDWEAFLKQHYWLGWYFWDQCYNHKNYKSGCRDCRAGGWRYINNSNQYTSDRLMKLSIKNTYTIFKMPMNNVVWNVNNDND